jgi:hypothetical protein
MCNGMAHVPWLAAIGTYNTHQPSCAHVCTLLLLLLQTFATCFNGGLSGSAAVRRCLTYRTSVSTPVTCPAQFLDFNFAIYGNNGKAL